MDADDSGNTLPKPKTPTASAPGKTKTSPTEDAPENNGEEEKQPKRLLYYRLKDRATQTLEAVYSLYQKTILGKPGREVETHGTITEKELSVLRALMSYDGDQEPPVAALRDGIFTDYRGCQQGIEKTAKEAEAQIPRNATHKLPKFNDVPIQRGGIKATPNQDGTFDIVVFPNSFNNRWEYREFISFLDSAIETARELRHLDSRSQRATVVPPPPIVPSPTPNTPRQTAPTRPPGRSV